MKLKAETAALLYIAVCAFAVVCLFASTANAQVLICSSVWGQAPSGCATGRCAAPSSTDLVSTDAAGADRGWKAFGTLAPTDKVDACAAKNPADYRDITGRVAVSTLGSTPVPPVVPPPTPTPGSLTITWTAPTTNTDGTPANVTGYRVTWTGAASGEAVLGNVLTYTLTGAPGTYYVRVYARDATGESGPTNPVAGVITASAPPPPPPPAPVVATVGYASGVTQIPVFAMTSTNARSSTVVGVIPVGVACIGPQLTTYRNQGYRRVPRANVIWWATTPTDNAMAACK
jgi:hypothetical protein